jgi:signal transduction histidine kinase
MLDNEAMNDLNKATLQWLNDLTAQGIFTTDANLRIQGWNRWLENHSGYHAPQVIGRDLLALYPQLVERRLDQWYRQALNGHVMVLAQRLHGYLLPMPLGDSGSGFAQMQQSARIAPLTAEGRIIGTITLIEDVTEREAREAALQHQIAALEALHDVSSAILSLDLPECLQRLVETTAMLVRAPTVAVVLRYDDRLHVEARTAGLHEIDNARVNLSNSTALAVIRSGQPLFLADLAARQSLTPLNPDSRSVMATPLIADSRVIGGLIIEAPTPDAFSRVDQTQVMMLATQAAIGIRNAQLYREAQEAIHARDTFLSIASHELKTPLTTLLGNAQMLQRRVTSERSLNERDTRTIGVISAQATRLNRMVAALLDLSRIQTGQLSIEREPLDLCQLAQRVMDEIQPMLDQHTIALNTPDEPLVIEGDELRLEQVVQNLIQNAVKYSPAGSSIQVQVQRQRHTACLQVIDEGIGIPEDALPQLFTRFYRASNVQEQHISGMGVGLHIVKEIIELHQGQVAVTSQEGHGSTFSVCLPLADEQQSNRDTAA